MLGAARGHDVAAGGDRRVRDDVVAGEAVLAGQPAHPAAEGQAADAGVRHVAGGGGQPVRLRRPVERAEQRATLHPGATADRVDPDAAHEGEVDHEAAVGDGTRGHEDRYADQAREKRVPLVRDATRQGRSSLAAAPAAERSEGSESTSGVLA